jgi:hypothetical protein
VAEQGSHAVAVNRLINMAIPVGRSPTPIARPSMAVSIKATAV